MDTNTWHYYSHMTQCWLDVDYFFKIKKKILVMTVQMDELTWSRSLQHVCGGPNMAFYFYVFFINSCKTCNPWSISHSESHRLADFLTHKISSLTSPPGSFMLFLVKHDFNKLNIPLKWSSLAWWEEGETIQEFQTLQAPLDHQKLNQMMTTA